MYKKAAQKLPKDLSLPGLTQYTQQQQFWLSIAHYWCAKEVPFSTGDRHSPGKLRVLGPLSQTEDFGKDWSCPQGAPMNPVNKCGLW